MSIQNIITYVSILVWSTIPFRHTGNKYFYFFYFTALMDPLTLYLRLVFHSSSNFFYMPLQYLTLIALFNKQIIIKNKVPIIILLVIIGLINIKIDLLRDLLLNSLIIFSILLKLFVELFTSTFKQKLLNLFLITLILNMVLMIFQFLGVYTGYLNGYFYFYIAIILEIFIGLFFWIFKEDNPKLLIKLNNR